TIEWHRQLQLIRGYTEIRARDGHALGVAGKLEFRRSRLQRVEIDIAIAEDEHAPASNAAMHSSRHLQYLVGAEVQLGEHVLSLLDDRRETRIVDDHRVEPLHVERALPRCRHGEEV